MGKPQLKKTYGHICVVCSDTQTLTIEFMSVNKEVIGKIVHENFDLEDSELAIFDTKKLLNLISITSSDLMFTLEKGKSVYTKMHFADNAFNLTYALADPFKSNNTALLEGVFDWKGISIEYLQEEAEKFNSSRKNK